MNSLTGNPYCEIGSVVIVELDDWANIPLVWRDELPSKDGMTTSVCCHKHVFGGREYSKICDEEAGSN